MRSVKVCLACIVSVLALLSVAAVLPDGSDAAPSVSGQSIVAYTEASENYLYLAYIEDTLPDKVDPSRYVRHDGLWYNVDGASSANGSYLTYGDLAPEMSVAEMRADLTARYGATFTLVQVSLTVASDCNVEYNIVKDETTYVPTSFAAKAEVEGFDVQSFKYVKTYVLGTDFTPADSVGTYTLNVKCDGSSLESVSTQNGTQTVTVTGYVKDLSERPISDALVYYNKSDNVESHTSTDAAGKYTIVISKGDLVKVTSAARSSYTFLFDPINTGNITSDAVLPDIHSRERTVQVHVTDQTGTHPAADVRVTAEWHVQTHDAVTDQYSLTKTTAGSAYTDEAGNALIICKDPSAEKYGPLIYASTQTNGYDFDLDGDQASPSATEFNFLRKDQPGSFLTADGNDYANLADYSAVTNLKAEESCIVVTVRGLQEGLEGGAPIPEITIGADWYYQVDEGGSYTYSKTPTTAFHNMVRGSAFAVAASGADGKVLVAYTLPTWDSDPALSAYLYIYAVTTSGVFAFSVPDLGVGGTTSFPDVVSAYGGAVALPSGSVAATEILSDDVAFKVSGTISGTLPPSASDVVIAYSLYKNVDSLFSGNATLDMSSSPATFSYTVKKGLFSRIDLAVITGYVFAEPSRTMPTATGDQAFSTECSAVSYTPVARAAPVLLETYTVDGLAAGTAVQFKCDISGTAHTFEKTATGTSLTFPLNGVVGAKIVSVSVSGEGLYVPAFTGTTVTVAAMTTLTVVCFSEDGVTEPTTENVVKEASVRAIVDGKAYTATTSSAGTATLSVPSGYPVEYKFVSGTQEYTVTATAMASGPFAGMNAINLTEVVTPDVSTVIHLIERHVSYSSLYNTSPAQATVLSSQTTERETGTAVKYTAPNLDGFKFSGWFLGAECLSESATVTIDIKESLDGQTLSAVYSPVPEAVPDKGVDPMVLMIGLVAIMIAIMCFAYVLLNNRGY